MIALNNIRPTLETTLEADDTFSNYTVILDDGWQHDEIETALRDDGICVTIGPLVNMTPGPQECGECILECRFPVFLELNPSVNADKETPLVFDTLLSSLVKAIIDIAADDAAKKHSDNDRYRVDNEGIRLLATDEQGPQKYMIPVVKKALVT